jgi:hypothetical protein
MNKQELIGAVAGSTGENKAATAETIARFTQWWTMNKKQIVAAMLVGVCYANSAFAQSVAPSGVRRSDESAKAPSISDRQTSPSPTNDNKHHRLHFGARKSSASQTKPKLKPDYPCQNFHVKSENCPPKIEGLPE